MDKIDEAYFKTIFNNTIAGAVLINFQKKILCSNPAVQHLLKYSEEELQGKLLKDITSQEDYNKDDDLFNEIISGSRTKYSVEKKFIAKGNDVIYVRTSLSLMEDYLNGSKGILVIVENIAWQKRFEKKLAYEQNFLKALLESSPDMIYFKDLESRFLKVSSAMARKLNISVNELIDKTDFDVFGANHAGNAFRDEQEIIRTGIPIIGKEEKENWPDGRTAWVSTSKMPFYDHNGKLIGTFGISRDITIRKRIQQSQEAVFKISETSFSSPDMLSLFKRIHRVVGSLLNAKNLYIAMYNEDENKITYPYYIDQYNAPPEINEPGHGMTELVMRTGKATLVDSNKLIELEKAGEIKLTGTAPKAWLGVPLKITQNITGIIAVQDYELEACYGESEMQLFAFIAEQIAHAIERKKSSEEIKKYTEELKQLNTTKDRFFTIIAHDLKNPFITILGFTDLLTSDYYELSDEERLSFISEMKKSAELSFNLLQNLLQWSRSQTGNIEFKPKKLDLYRLVEDNLLLIQNPVRKKQISLQNNVIPLLWVTADEEMLNTILRNLLTNALKFSNKGGCISVGASVNGSFIEVYVADTGVGMDKKAMDKLFRLDVVQSTPGTENEAGTGLGLILCKEFVEKNKGRIWVESELGKGSKFKFTLPA